MRQAWEPTRQIRWGAKSATTGEPSCEQANSFPEIGSGSANRGFHLLRANGEHNRSPHAVRSLPLACSD